MASASLALEEAELQGLRELTRLALAEPSLACAPRSLILRFLLHCKGDTAKAICTLKELAGKRAILGISDTFDDGTDRVAATLNGQGDGAPQGYWNFAGPSASGSQCIFLLQHRATPCADWDQAVNGFRAAHHFFFAATADLDALRSGVTLVVDMTGVSATHLLSMVNDRAGRGMAKAVGDPYTHIVPVRPKTVYMVGCTRLLVAIVRATVLATLPSKLRARVKYLRDYDELANLVPRSSWPPALIPHGESNMPTLEQTPIYARSRIAAFENACDNINLDL